VKTIPESYPPVDTVEKPTVSELIVIQHAVQEAFDQATRDLDEQGGLPAGLPCFTGMAAAEKRIRDVMSGRRERIDLKREWKRFMLERFPEYRFDRDQPDYLWFRKPLADHIEGLLLVRKVHLFGLGKCFTLHYQADFPGTRFAGQHPLHFSRSLFSLLHRGWLEPEWAYSSNDELAQVLDGCRQVLQLALPALEKHMTSLLCPLPTVVPEHIPVQGRLTAREAYGCALGIVTALADDAIPIGIMSGAVLASHTGPGVGLDGRLQPHGHWYVRFQSERLSCHFLIVVPHTGQVSWQSSPDSRMEPQIRLRAFDSPDAMREACQILGAIAQGEELHYWSCDLRTNDSFPSSAWMVHARFRPLKPGDGRAVTVYLDPVDGKVLRSE
jgi:hypothetical protein